MKKISVLAGLFASALLCLTGCEKGITNNPEPSGEASLTPKPTVTAFVTPAPIAHSEGSVKFSIVDTFLEKTGKLELSAEGATEIYYTLDGSIPTRKSQKFGAPVLLQAGSEVKAYCVSARALYKDGSWSETVSRTYFAGKNVMSRYDCIVVSITTDPSNLWDYETGIFAEGKIMADYIKEHPGAYIDGSTPANYNQLKGMEGERPVFVEMFNSDGSTIISQDSGLRCYGGWSRRSAMKPMKLLARKSYSEENNKFRYPFFTTSLDENNEVIDSFKRLVLRASGNDNGFAFIREELYQTLAKQAGYLGKSVRPCAVYVNGEYYGAYWLTEVYHESYFESHYGKFEGTMQILEGNEKWFALEDDGSNKAAVNEYLNMYETFSKLDLTDDSNYEDLCEIIDVQNYLEYYAFQMFIGNEDWPVNNYKIYRYYPAENDTRTEAPFDGKWRYLIHDTDFSTGIYNSDVMIRSYKYYLGKPNGVKEDICPLFGQLMKRDDCKAVFIRKMLDLLNGVFAEDYFNQQVDILNACRMNEQSHTYSSGKLESWVQPFMLDEKIADLKKWVKARTNYMYNDTISFFKFSGKDYKLHVNVPENCEVTINSWTVNAEFTGKYIATVDTVLTAEDNYGRAAIAWMVDGTRVDGEKLTIDADMVNGKAQVDVQPVFE